jgi:hypothetical protein
MSGYGDDAGFEAWMTATGRSVPVSAPSSAVLRQRASDYLDALYGARFTGYPTGGLDQERAWPRTGATAQGHRRSLSNVVPAAVSGRPTAAAWHEANNPGSLSVAVSAAAAVKREKIDVIDTEYFASGASAIDDATVRLSEVEGLLAPFLRKAGAREPMVLVV